MHTAAREFHALRWSIPEGCPARLPAFQKRRAMRHRSMHRLECNTRASSRARVAGIDIQHVELFIEYCNCRQEAAAMQSIRIESIRRVIGRHDELHALPEQTAK